jgi:23S rRNA (uracil1939-C5)-methyltransferase
MEKLSVPVEKNQILKINIQDIGVHGEGIGRYEGYTLFIDGGLPGEEVEVKVVKVGKKYGFAKLIHTIKPSPDRVEAVCPVARTCGGCQLQHMSYDSQLSFKTKKVSEAIKRIGKIEDVEVKPTLGMEEPWHYRNKVIYPVRDDRGITKIGFYASRTHKVVEHEKCYIQNDKNEAIIKVVKEWMVSNGITAYNEETSKGMIRHIMTRYSHEIDKFHVTIVSNKRKLKHVDLLIEEMDKLGYIDGISLSLNLEKTNRILGNKVTLIWGHLYLAETINGRRYEISPKSFFQVNNAQTGVLYEKALAMADLQPDETLMDLYCGIGSMTVYMASKVKKAIGVEIIEEAIEDADRNQELNGLDNIDFYIGAAEDVIPHLYDTKDLTADVIIVDPPRKGCDERLLETMAKMAPRKIVYVSCDPATLARDLKYLCEHGYKVDEIQPIDMFPMTLHVETVVRLSLK